MKRSIAVLIILGLASLGLSLIGCGFEEYTEVVNYLDITDVSPARYSTLGSFPVKHTVTFEFEIVTYLVNNLTAQNLFPHYMRLGPEHTVGNPTVASISWSSDHRTLTVNISGWSDADVEDKKVSILGTSKIYDNAGNVLRDGALIWRYDVVAGATTTTTTTTTTSSTTTSTTTTTSSTTTSTVWTPKSSGVSDDLNAIHFGSATNGYAVGANGVIIKTTDGGSSWSSISSGTNEALNGVVFRDCTNGWVVGDMGTALYTTNGGTNWVASSPASANLNDVAFDYDITTGYYWVVGDSGIIWRWCVMWNQYSSGTANDLFGVWFNNKNTGWAVGANGTILHTTNGSLVIGTWANQISATTNNLHAVQFGSLTNGCAVGDAGTILWTTDGGSHWNTPTGMPACTNDLRGIHFGDTTNVWAVGDNGTVLHSADGGDNWTYQETAVTNRLENLYFHYNTTNGWAVGSNGTLLEYNP